MKRKILIAEKSKTIQNLLLNAFENTDYECVVFSDGLEALDYVLNHKIDALLCNSVLSGIDGSQFASVLRNGTDFDMQPFILYCAEDTPVDYTIKVSDASEVFNLTLENCEELVSHLNNYFPADRVEIEEVEELESLDEDDSIEELEEIDDDNGLSDLEKNGTVCAVKAMENKTLRLDMLSGIFRIGKNIYNLNKLSEEILKMLYSICDYDCAVLILNDVEPTYYYAIAGEISEEQKQNCRNICCSEFISLVKKSDNLKFEFIEFKNIVNRNIEGEFKAVKTYVLKYEEMVVGTLNILSSKRNFFSYKLIFMLEYFTENVSSVLINSLRYKQLYLTEKRMRSAFSKFVPDEIIDEMIKRGDTSRQYETEKRNVAILICDIRSFTTLSEKNKPENVVSFLNGYFTRMVDIIKKHGGSIDKFMGDAIMALFGAPISYSDNAKRAVDAAIEMKQHLDEIPTGMLKFSEEVPCIDFGVGIHYGEVIVGNIGCKDKTDYTVIGDSANLASRLEGLTKQYGANIIVSKKVVDAIKETVKDDKSKLEEYNFIQLDKVKVKGKFKGIDIFRAGEQRFSEKYKTLYESGLSMLFVGNYSYAIEYFEKAKNLMEKDKACDLLINICKEFAQNPPENIKEGRVLTAK